MERMLGNTVLDTLWRDVPNSKVCKITIVALKDSYGVPARVVKTGYALDLYSELTAEYDIDELQSCRLQSLTYRPYTDVIEMIFLKPIYNTGC